jgi:hypothetical protein
MQNVPLLLLTPVEVLVRGFRYISGLPEITDDDWSNRRISDFKKHYGSSPTIIAFLWQDIQQHIDVSAADKSEKGFRSLLTAIHFLWAYPKNAAILASTVGVSGGQVKGVGLWKWVYVIAQLTKKSFVWPTDKYGNPNGRIFIVSVDGVDFRVWEKKHPTYNIDRGQYSHKFKHGALKYEIAIDTYHSRVVWINGPFRGGAHDKVIYSSGLKDRIPVGKKVVCDRVYGAKAQPDDHEKLALPNLCDSKELHNYKARLRCRHETFNGRIKFFRVLSDTFRHSTEHHKAVFQAVCVMVQYQMDHGSPLFSA